MRRFLAKFVNVFRGRRAETEMTREIESHLALLEEDFERNGLSPAEAKFAARRAYGNVGQVKELHRETRSIVWIEQVTNDVNYALRNLLRNPGFTLVTVITLALGIGGSTGMFALIRSVLLRPLEYREPDRLVYLSTDNLRRNQNDIAFTLIRLEQIRASAQSFTGIGAFLNSPEDITLSGGDPETLKGARVSANFLDVLGIPPKVGRSFLPEEETSGGRPVAMISTALWKRRFVGNPQILGGTVSLDLIPHVVIGVLPEGFAFPFADVDVWVTKPSQWSRVPPQYWRTLTLLKGFARLKKRATLEQARAELDVLNRQYLRAHPDFGAERG